MKKNILILEDEEILGNLYAKKLSTAGYKVELTKTAEDALKKAHLFAADLCLIDHRIRGHEVSGLDILPQLKKLLPKTKIIVLSNFNKFQLEQNALKLGADGYLVKINMSPGTIAQYISHFLKDSSQEQKG